MESPRSLILSVAAATFLTSISSGAAAQADAPSATPPIAAPSAAPSVTTAPADALPTPALPAAPAAAKAPAPTEPAPPHASEPLVAPPAHAANGANGGAHENGKDKAWYERVQIRGYAQARFNRLYSSNDDLKNDLADKTIGGKNGVSLRRARLIVQGEVMPFLAIYLQGEFASAINDSLGITAMRDWYADVSVDPKKEFRFRVGQSKVPYGFENMQSSQNRAPLDRSDAINSAAPGERDIGAFFYWAPEDIRRRFKHLVDSGLKGSGDYGVLAIGAYNGQGINLRERNDNRHVVARLTYPFKIGEQFLELGVGGYTGKFFVNKAEGITGVENYVDARVNGSITLYPQPIGFQAEFNVGKGPEQFGKEVLGSRPLHGGYAMVMARAGGFVPYVRGAIYDGGLKTATNSPRHEVKELEAGVEWQFHKALEVTVAANVAERTVNGKEQHGWFGRLQVQFNY